MLLAGSTRKLIVFEKKNDGKKRKEEISLFPQHLVLFQIELN